MHTRTLGSAAKGTALEVSAIGYGCMGLSQSYPPYLPREESLSVIRKAHELGVTFFDTPRSTGLMSTRSFSARPSSP